MKWTKEAIMTRRREKNPKRPISTRDSSGSIRHDWSSELPFAPDDEITVFHGFYDHNEAISAARYGLSGHDPVSRNYSYESDNNPRGLFVSIDPQTAEGFATDRRMKVVMEFDTKLEDLEAPCGPEEGMRSRASGPDTSMARPPDTFGALTSVARRPDPAFGLSQLTLGPS